MSDYFCVLQAMLDASSDLNRPLSAQTVQRLVHIIERHHGWPSDRHIELLDLVRDELDVLLLVEKGAVTVSPESPCVVFYATSKGDNHSRFCYPPFPEAKQMHSLLLLRPREKGISES